MALLKNLDFVLYSEKDYSRKVVLGVHFRKIMAIVWPLDGSRERQKMEVAW